MAIFQPVNENLPNSSCHFWRHKSVFQIFHQSSVPSNVTPLYFFSSNIKYFNQKQPMKVQIYWDFRVLGSKFVKFLVSILNWQVNSFSNFASFFIFITHYSLVNFKLKHFLLWIKESHQSPNFETFKCSSETFTNSSCPFWKHKSVFLQVLDQFLVSSNITPL